jgi:hypothetical protein
VRQEKPRDGTFVIDGPLRSADCRLLLHLAASVGEMQEMIIRQLLQIFLTPSPFDRDGSFVFSDITVRASTAQQYFFRWRLLLYSDPQLNSGAT